MSFEKSLSILNDLEKEVNAETRKISLNLLNGLTIRTPVDTGRAAGNWNVSPSAKADRSVDEFRRAAQARAQGQATIHSVITQRGLPTITISNSLPYIEKLNDGHSLKAPKMFVELEMQRVTR